MVGPDALRVAFCHPDLGLGGAERLVVDAACELRERGHAVVVYASGHDPNRCFEETRDGTLEVRISNGWMPRSLFGKGHVLLAWCRCWMASLRIAFEAWWNEEPWDVVFVDQVSAGIPLLKRWTSARVLYYCHFPDLLLVDARSVAHRAYRAPIDRIEEWTTGQADRILTNSRYTSRVFRETFRSLDRVRIDVLHPAVDVPERLLGWEGSLDVLSTEVGLDATEVCRRSGCVFLSLNRFERKKDLGLAIDAFEVLLGKGSFRGRKPPLLVLAGGYDQRIADDVRYRDELLRRRERDVLKDRVIFLHNVTDHAKHALLSCCTCVLYTPQFEHFGIVPLEAMARAKPVIACNSGGPTESVLDGKTGFLVDPNPLSFADAMEILTSDPETAIVMGRQAREHVRRHFSRASFGERLHQVVMELGQDPSSS